MVKGGALDSLGFKDLILFVLFLLPLAKALGFLRAELITKRNIRCEVGDCACFTVLLTVWKFS